MNQLFPSSICVQVELDSTICESSIESVSMNFYHRNFVRCQALITHVSNLTDGVSLLTQATEALLEGERYDFSLFGAYIMSEKVKLEVYIDSPDAPVGLYGN